MYVLEKKKGSQMNETPTFIALPQGLEPWTL